MRPYRLNDGAEARDYQMRAAHRIFTGQGEGRSRDGIATIIDMGLGKTFITLQAIADLYKWNVLERPVILIAPIMVIETVWRQEAAIWNTTNWLTFSLIRGTAGTRKRALRKAAHIYLINPELIGWLYDQLKGDWSHFDMLVVDESSMFKDPRSKRFNLLSKASKSHIVKNRFTGESIKDDKGVIRTKPHKFRRSVILTGTPSPTTLLNLWPQIFLLDQGKRLHEKYETYRERYFYKQGQVADHVYRYGVSSEEFETRPDWMPKDGAPTKIHEHIADITVELDGKDYGVLPATIGDASTGPVPPSHLHGVELPQDVREMYDRLEKEALVELNNDFILAANGGSRTLMCQQIANGFLYRDDELGTQHTEILHSLKLEKLKDVLEMLNTNCIIAFHFKADRIRLLEYLSKHGFSVANMTTKNAPAIIDQWNKGSIEALLLHPQSAGHGINLQLGGHNIVWYSQTWSLERYLQTNARIARSGQKHIVGMHHIVATKTVDELMLSMYQQRGDSQSRFRSALRGYQAMRGWGIEGESPPVIPETLVDWL